MNKLTWIAAGAALLIAACGGKVVFDGQAGGGGLGGPGGGAAGGGSTGPGVGGGSCWEPPDPATLTFCSSSGTGDNCQNVFCDDQGNQWSATCTKTACVCRFNTEVMCTCALNTPGNFCSGTPTCCPLPKL